MTKYNLPARHAEHLEKRHAELAERVAMLDARHHLTPSEEMELQRLKKEKLFTKDQLEGVRPSVPPPAG